MGWSKNIFFFWKKTNKNGRFSKWPFFKIANSQIFFVKISWIGPWVRRPYRLSHINALRINQELVILKNSVFLSRPFWIFFCLIPMKISHKLCDRMDGTQIWCFSWFPANSLLFVIFRYTVYMYYVHTTTYFWGLVHTYLFVPIKVSWEIRETAYGAVTKCLSMLLNGSNLARWSILVPSPFVIDS